ncbi:MAG: SRPBCC family protein [Hyphomicrobiales bacterium]
MTEDLVLERVFPATVERVFAFITQRDHLVTWWGPEGIELPDETLDFTKLGPWHSVMMNADGGRHKVSGEVTEVSPPNKIAFTWAWHDEDDQRGHESLVTIDISAEGDDATRFVLTQRSFASDESKTQHSFGWTSSLRKLESAFA